MKSLFGYTRDDINHMDCHKPSPYAVMDLHIL